MNSSVSRYISLESRILNNKIYFAIWFAIIFSWYVLNTGDLRDWWANDTFNKFADKAKCLIEQYDGYFIKQINMSHNGRISVSENIADLGGVKSSYMAYGIKSTS